jgi:hypothetical protein
MKAIAYSKMLVFDLLFLTFVASYQNFKIHAIIFGLLFFTFTVQVRFKLTKEEFLFVSILLLLNLSYFSVKMFTNFEKSLSDLMSTFVFIFLIMRYPNINSSERYLGGMLVGICVLYFENQITGQFVTLQNNFGLLVAAALVGYCCVVVNSNKYLLTFAGVIAALSFKRAALVASVFLIIHSIFDSKGHSKFWYLLVSALGLYIVYLSYEYLYVGDFSLYVERVIEKRLSVESVTDGTGRFGIYDSVLTLLPESFIRLLFFPVVQLQNGTHAHNQFLEYIAVLGFWTVLFQIILLALLARYIYKHSKSPILGLFCCVYILLNTLVSIPLIELHFLLPLLYFYTQKANSRISSET